MDDAKDREVIPEGLPPQAENAPARKVVLEGCFNFRDLGGYLNSDGRRLVWRKVYRSDALSRLTDGDRQTLSRMGLKLVIDLRSTAEADKQPDLLPEDGSIELLHLPIQTGEMNFVAAMEKMKQGDVSWLTPDYMRRGYLKNIEEFADIWPQVFRRLAEPSGLPLVFHCTGGKDRAGTCAALILLALGVPEETVIEDHQLSNVMIAPLVAQINRRMEGLGIDPEKVRPYFTAPLDGIQALLEHLLRKYGTAENYLIDRGGLEPWVLESIRRDLLAE